MTIEGQTMRIQAWTPDFTPEEETPVVPIWVSIPGLPWHCYNKVFLSTVLESIGKVLFLDSPTSQRTRGSTIRVKVQIDLTKERPSHVWLGFKNSNPNKGRWLKVEYEGIPSYCFYCRHQGHKDEVCTIKRRDEEIQQRKEMNAAKNSKEKGNGKNLEQEKTAREETTKPPNQPNKNLKEGMKNREEQNQSKEQGIDSQHKQDRHKQEEQSQQEEHQGEKWQTQKKRNQKNQENVTSKSVWRPVTAPLQHTNNNQQQEQSSTGNNIIPTQNNFSYLEMQEQQETQHTEQQGFREKANQEDHNTYEQGNDQPVGNKQNNLQTPNLQAAEDNKCKEPGIDLSLPNPRTPNDSNATAGHTDEINGGMDGGCKEKTTNLQDGVTKGGILPHAMHEGLDYDHRTDLRGSRNDEYDLKHQNQQSQQQNQISGNWEQTAKENKGQQQHRKKEGEEQGKQGDNKDIGNTPKIKNKPSKQKRDAEKRRQNRQQEKESEYEQEVREESCNKFVMVDDNQGLDIPPLQI